MARYHYKPTEAGWIGIQDRGNKTLAHIDCREGGAQQVFAELCHDLQRAGWQLEGRTYDWQFVRRGPLRWEIRIGILAPGQEAKGPYG
jgi:hypothetical protein